VRSLRLGLAPAQLVGRRQHAHPLSRGALSPRASPQVIGNAALGEKFAAASKLMRRDIVFAASLYL
jgi:hypothetical protein